MKDMKNIDPTDSLEHLQKVNAPEFMLTRIYAKIEDLKEVKIKPSIAWSLLGTFSLVVFINAFVLIKSSKSSNDTESIVTEMGMEINNSIY